MGGFVNSVEMATLDNWTGKTAYTIPTWYVGLSTTTPTEGSGIFTEPSNGGYNELDTSRLIRSRE